MAQEQQQQQQQHQQKQLLPGMWQWPSHRSGDTDNSSEVRAFADDSKSYLATWPPRCYTCTFCRREFRSAQALGGHMNVHRRDRAKLHQSPMVVSDPSSSSASPPLPPLVISNGGMCFFYPLPAVPNGAVLAAAPPTGTPVTCTFIPTTSFSESIKSDSSASSTSTQELDLELRLGW